MEKLILGLLVIVGNLVFSGALFALETNIEQIRKVAEKGHPAAQYKLGNSFFHGNGVARNNTEALVWYKKAADQGHPEAQYWIGVSLHHGLVGEVDTGKAYKWYSEAAERGYEPAHQAIAELKRS